MGWERRLLVVSCTAAAAGLLMIGVVSQCSMRFDYYDLRGKTLQQLGSHRMAVEEMKKAAAFTPPSAAALAELYHNLGVSEAQLGELRAARKCYESALSVAPEYALAHYSLANLLIRQEQFKLAERHYLAAISAKTDFSDAYANLGHMLESQGRRDEAIDNYRRALQIEPGAEDLRQMLENAIRNRD
jgi:tetratricopeptide (TPR) repeat protein